MRFLFWGFRRWLAAKIRPRPPRTMREMVDYLRREDEERKAMEPKAWVTYWGGSRCGERELLALSHQRVPETARAPLVASPHARADREDIERVVVIGWYVRDGAIMRWRNGE